MYITEHHPPPHMYMWGGGGWCHVAKIQRVDSPSTQSDGSDCGWRDVLVAVQRLVEELTVLVSSLDQGKNTQLPQQVHRQCQGLI